MLSRATGEAATPGCLAATHFATRQRQRQPVGAELQGCRLFDSLQRGRLQGRIKTQGAAADSRADPISVVPSIYAARGLEETPIRSTCRRSVASFPNIVLNHWRLFRVSKVRFCNRMHTCCLYLTAAPQSLTTFYSSTAVHIHVAYCTTSSPLNPFSVIDGDASLRFPPGTFFITTYPAS